MFEITAITKGESIYLRYYDSPMPSTEFERQLADPGNHYKEFLKQSYELWQQSVKEVKVHPNFECELETKLILDYRKRYDELIGFSDEFEKGIPCDFLKDRIEIKEACRYGCECGECKNGNYYAILTPLDLPIEERQEELTTMNKFIKDLNGICDKHKMPGVGTLAFENIINNYFNFKK